MPTFCEIFGNIAIQQGFSLIGPNQFFATTTTPGKFIYASPNGTGSGLSPVDPCSLTTAKNNAVAGDCVFLRGGVYPISVSLNFSNTGLANAPVIFESYPGELAE